jgi:diguanylate cyclase (GGDEF)-like protein
MTEDLLPPAAGRPRQYRYSLRTSLFWLVTACLVPASLLSAVLAYQNYRLQREQVYQHTILMARKIAADLDRELTAAESGLRVLATSPALVAGDLKTFHHRAREALRSQNVHNYLLIDRQGRQLLDTRRAVGEALPNAGTPVELRRIFDSGATVLTDLFTDPLSGQSVIAIGVPVFRGNEVVYSLSAEMSLDHIAAILNRQRLPDEWRVAILDAAGTIIARTHDAPRFIGQKAVEPVLQFLAENREGSLDTRSKEGIPVVSSFSRSAISNWSAAVAAPKAALEAELYRLIVWLLAGTVSATSLALWLVSRLAGRVTASVRGLNDAALALGAGKPVHLPSIQLEEADAVGEAILKASRIMAQVRHLAQHDMLTGLCNRVLFSELLAHHLAAATREQGSLAVLAIDLDGFKAVNDLHGHTAGDRVLKIAAERMLRAIRASDAAARLGGDEFSVLLDHADQAHALQTAARLVAVLAEPYASGLPAVSASVGIALYPQSGSTAAALMESADRALYRAKKLGKKQAAISSGVDCA